MMDSLGAFLAMGGYAAYVWPAFALAALVLGALVAVSLRELRARAREVAALEQDSPRRRGRRAR